MTIEQALDKYGLTKREITRPNCDKTYIIYERKIIGYIHGLISYDVDSGNCMIVLYKTFPDNSEDLLFKFINYNIDVFVDFLEFINKEYNLEL